MLVSRRHKLVFVHAMKTGGTSLRNILIRRFGFEQYGKNWHEWRVPASFAAYQVFGCVRNPYDRFVSMWSFLRSPHSRAYGILDRRAEQETFLQFVDRTLGKGPCGVVPLSTTFPRQALLLRFEQLEHDFNRLPFVSRPVQLPQLNRSEHATWDAYYDHIAEQRVYDRFHVDFVRYGYARRQLQFDVQAYLADHPDVAAAIQRGTLKDAQRHWRMFGRHEGRRASWRVL